jgi:hypothetical protein
MLSEMDNALADEIEAQNSRSGGHQIASIDDPSQWLDQLRNTLKNSDEGATQLGSKSFGLAPSKSDRQPSPVSFGEKFKPDDSQARAIEVALGSEVTYIVGSRETGKASTLAAIAFAHLQQGHTVLIAAQTHMAVDKAIMKLADVCKDTKNSAELQSGHIIRYGEGALGPVSVVEPAKPVSTVGAAKTSSAVEAAKPVSAVEDAACSCPTEYSDIHMPTIVEQRKEHLYQQKAALQASLDQVSAELNTMNWEYTLCMERWEKDTADRYAQCDAYERELLSLQEFERQCITPLDIRLRDLTNQLDQASHLAETISQRIRWLMLEHSQQKKARAEHLTQINDLKKNVLTFLDKGSNLDSLSQRLAHIEQQLSNDDWLLANLEKRRNEKNSARAAAQKQIEEFTSEYRNVEEQRNMLSTDAQRIALLQTKIFQNKQHIEQGEIIINTMRQRCHGLENTKKHIKIQIDHLGWQLENMERKVISEARVVATTLCNIYMSLDLHKRRFDVVILDEVPMASLPSVYVAVSHADSSVVLIGDPQQSAPISHAETPATKNWLATDLFTFRQITLEEAAKGSNNSILLGQQAPMQTSILPIVSQDIPHRPVTHGQMDKSSLRRFFPGLRSSNTIWLVNALVVWWSQQQAIRDLVGKDEQDPNTIVSDNPSIDSS